jgi:hypothetical protein
MKARQAAKLREIREALVADGVVGLTEQAAALGLSRSTAWTIVTGIHKGSGLSVRTINRMLAMPLLPPTVRSTIIDYIKEKTAGNYGGTRLRKSRAASRHPLR